MSVKGSQLAGLISSGTLCDPSLMARFMGPTWGPPRADRTQVDPMWAKWTLLSGLLFKLTYHILVTPCGGTDTGQQWLSKWPVAWRHQVITWTDVDSRILVPIPAQFHRKCARYAGQKTRFKINFLEILMQLPGDTWINPLRHSESYMRQ